MLLTQGFIPPHFFLSQCHCPTEGHFPQPSCADQSRHMLSPFRLRCRARIRSTHWGPSAHSSKGKRRAHRAVRTSLEHPNAWRLCATARCPTDPNRAKHFLTKACPTSLAPCLSPLRHKPLKTNSTTGLDPTVSLDTDSPRTSKLCPVPQLGLWGVFPTVPVAFYFFPKCCLCVLCHKNLLHSLWPPSSSKGPSLFDFHLASLLTLPFSFLVVIAQLLPSAAFNSFADHLAKGMPISVYQGWSPPVLRNVTDIDVRFLCSQGQFLGTFPDWRLGHPSSNFGLRNSEDHIPSFKWPTSKAQWWSTLIKFLRPSIIPFLLLSQRHVTKL